MASIGMISTSTMFATVHFLASATILTHPPIMATEKEIQCNQYSLSTTSNMNRQLLRQKISVMETNNWCFQKNSLFWHFNSCFVL
jgi:hypothetical protein